MPPIVKSHRVGVYRGYPIFKFDAGSRKGQYAVPTGISRRGYKTIASAHRAIDKYLEGKKRR